MKAKDDGTASSLLKENNYHLRILCLTKICIQSKGEIIMFLDKQELSLSCTKGCLLGTSKIITDKKGERAREMAQCVRVLAVTNEDLSLDPQHSRNSQAWSHASVTTKC